MASFLTESVLFPAVADVLIDAASVLGGDATLRILYMKLDEVCIDFSDYNPNSMKFWSDTLKIEAYDEILTIYIL